MINVDDALVMIREKMTDEYLIVFGYYNDKGKIRITRFEKNGGYTGSLSRAAKTMTTFNKYFKENYKMKGHLLNYPGSYGQKNFIKLVERID